MSQSWALKLMLAPSTALLAGAVAWLALWRGHALFARLFAYACACACALAWRARGKVRAWALCAAAVLLGAAGLELRLSRGLSHGGDYFRPGRFSRPDPVLGFVPIPGRRTRGTLTRGGELIYDVSYGVDRHGLRAAAGAGPAAAGAILFFGCSFTFGQGVEDAQAYPARVEALLAPRYETLNFGVPGYGPHHMLRILETESEREALAGRRPRHAFYLAIPDHVHRSAGAALMHLNGPRYELDASGRPVHAGELHGPATRTVLRALARSRLFLAAYGRWRKLRPARQRRRDLDLFAAMVAASKRLFEERYQARLHVLAWDRRDELICPRLRREGVDCVSVREALPGFDFGRYTLSPYDRHPNPFAHEQLASYVARRVEPGAAQAPRGR